MAKLTIYDTRSTPSQPIVVDSEELRANLNYAIQRFWMHERRMPAAIVLSEQLARAFMEALGAPLVGDLTLYGNFVLSQTEGIPVLGRPAYIDPLFTLI